MNPYSSPRVSDVVTTVNLNGKLVRGKHKGPAIYIVLGGLIAAFASPMFLIRYDSTGLFFPAIGCMAGAIVYRIRSRNWPIDRTAIRRQLIYGLIALISPAMVIYSLVGTRAQGYGMIIIGGIVGMSVAFGILLCGNKRDLSHDANSDPLSP